jgi:pimeloyl-ACP methyl ester carboxylesterase
MSFVLIHGGGMAASCWDLMVPHLSGDVVAVDLPGRGVRSHVPMAEATMVAKSEAVIEDILAADLHDVVLVGHSIAGAVIPRVVAAVPDRIAHVVLVAALVPPDGTAVVDHIDPSIRETVEASVGDGIYDPGEDALRGMLCAEMDEETARWTLDRACPDNATMLLEPIDTSGLALVVPRTYVRTRLDVTVPAAVQEASLRNAPSEEVWIESGHMAMVEKPVELAAILEGVVRR